MFYIRERRADLEKVGDGRGLWEIEGRDEYQMLRCRGCERICFRHLSSFSDAIDEETGSPRIDVRYYPPATSRKGPDWLSEFSLKYLGLIDLHRDLHLISDLLEEIYEALHNGATRLAAMGVRSLLEEN